MKLVEYQCPHCNYHSSISVGEDFGYRTATIPMICKTCSSLVDVLIIASSPEQDRQLRRCPRCASTKVSPWNPLTMPCPKCGTTMQEASKAVI